MRIDLTQLEAGGQTVEETFGATRALAPPARARGSEPREALGASLRAWVRPEGRLVRASGEIRGTIRAECDRCLKAVAVDVAGTFDQRYAWQDADPARARGVPGEGIELGADELDLARLEGDVLETSELAREQLELASPMSVRCDAACAGLCPTCGVDRNHEVCGCADVAIDPRWEPLKNIMTGE
jgi:uncharacterized protein